MSLPPELSEMAYVLTSKWPYGILIVYLSLASYLCSKSDEFSILDDAKYLNYTELLKFFHKLHETYPNLTKVYNIGKSIQNRELVVLQISKDVSQRQLGKPMFKYVANMHGNEALGRQLLIILAEYLLKNYGKNDRVTEILNTTDIHLLPSMNPDGFEAAKEGDCSGAGPKSGRENAHDVDLNRNFPDQFDENVNLTEGREPETLAVMTWIVSNPFVLSANLHGGSLVASYPFDDSKLHNPSGDKSLSPDNLVFEYLARLYSTSHPQMHEGNVCPDDDFKDGITNGAEWYDVQGGMQDYNYVYSNCFEITLELSCCKYPPAENLSVEWQNNMNALLTYIEHVHMGIKGLVKDSTTGKGIPQAFIMVDGVKHNVTTTERGEYWRLLLPGNYVITASAYGYEAHSVKVIVEDGIVTITDFSLNSNNSPSKVNASSVTATIPSQTSTTLSPTDATTQTTTSGETSTHPVDKDFLTPPDFHHHNYTALQSFMSNIAKQNPRITRFYSVGLSVQGRELFAMEISDNPGMHEPGEPEFKYVGNMHGNEVVGREMLLLLIKLLVEGYGRNPRITSLVDNTRIHILPSMNPDGYEIAQEGDFEGTLGRENANNVDLNRNFPDQFHHMGSNEVQEPETRAVMMWILAYPFVLSANLHGGSLVANYPYDDNPTNTDKVYSKSPDDKVFRNLAAVYSDNHLTMHLAKPCAKGVLGETFPHGITNGAAWYSVPGGMQDWNYLHSNCFELTIEMGCFKYPYAADLPEYWKQNKPALLAYIEQVHTGVHGFVFDDNGNPLSNATIHVDGIDHDVISAAHGDYWRLLVAGHYTVRASFPGYSSQAQQITLVENSGIQLNFTLDSRIHLWSEQNDYGITENLKQEYMSTIDFHSAMRKLATDNTDIVKSMVNKGPDNKEALHFLVLSAQDSAIDDRPKVALIGGLHGDNSFSCEMLLRFVRHMIEGYRIGESRIKKLLEVISIHVIPCVDYYGFTSLAPGNCTNVVDPSVDMYYKFGKDSQRPFGPVEALKQCWDTYQYLALLTLESSGLSIQYPSANEGDMELLHYLGNSYSSNNPSFSHHQPCQSKHISSDGSILEFAYRNYGTLAITAQISCCSYPPSSELPAFWMQNLESLLSFLESTQQGVSGHIRDQSGNVIKDAQVGVKDAGKAQKVDVIHGSYSFILKEGSHVIYVNAPGYENKSMNVDISKKQHITLDVVLDPLKATVTYHDYVSASDMLNHLSLKFSSIAKLYSIGQTRNRRELWVLQISKNPGKHIAGQPEIVYTAGLHGNDIVTTELLLQFAEFILTHYGIDSIITELVNSTQIHIAPMLNPDGFSAAEKNNCHTKAGETNANNIDLDRTFFDSTHVITQAETDAIKWWIKNRKFVLSVSLFAGNLIVAHPYQKDNKSLPPLEKAIFHQLAVAYSTAHPSLHHGNKSCSNLSKAFPMGIANAASMHMHNGSFLDYIYSAAHIYGISVYVDCCNAPLESNLFNIWNEHKSALVEMLNQVHKGIHGFVRTKYSTAISKASIQILGANETVVYVDGDGAFWLPVGEGEYTLVASSEGYIAETKLVHVYAHSGIQVDFQLEDDSQVAGIPRHVFVIIVGSTVLVMMVVALFIYSSVIKKKASDYKFHRLDGSTGLFEDENRVDKNDPGVTKFLLKDREYHDDPSSEDELYNTYKWQNGK